MNKDFVEMVSLLVIAAVARPLGRARFLAGIWGFRDLGISGPGIPSF